MSSYLTIWDAKSAISRFYCCHIAGEIAAVKVMEVALDKEEDIKAELNVFQNHAHHPNIVNFYGAFVKKNNLAGDHLWLVMEVRRVLLFTFWH